MKEEAARSRALDWRIMLAVPGLKLLAHIEKTSNDTTADVRVAHLAIRCTDLAS